MEIRRLRKDESDTAALVHRAALDQRLPWLSGLHTPDDDRVYFRDRVFAECEVWGVFDAARLVGIVAFREGWIDQLYVLPSHQGHGLGSALLNVAKARLPTIRLWTFQRNAGARRFYEKCGFQVVEETDGSGNEEREPDVLYEWRRESALAVATDPATP
jgi:GNAT superfamily N-acetyltransferase